MPRTYVICIDGTWNKPGQIDKDLTCNEPLHTEEKIVPTNVVLTWQALTRRQLDEQRYYGSVAPLADQDGEALYLNGVGSTGSFLQKYFDGGTGTGTSERIHDAYHFLAERYRPGDSIFGFGFSRGAFAVRSLAGFIDYAGLAGDARSVSREELLDAYGRYRERDWINKRIGTPVRFLGLWDTVGALAFGKSFNHYHQTSPANLEYVAHALALDEQRSAFAPELWKVPNGAKTQLNETWFSGVHSNVGGGYRDAGLSAIAMFWVLKEANKAGLAIDLKKALDYTVENSAGLIRNSYREFWSEIPLGAVFENLKLGKKARDVALDGRVHASVFDRLKAHDVYTPAAALAAGAWRPLPQSLVQEPWELESPR